MNTPLGIPTFNSYELDLPAWMAVKTSNYGNPRSPIWWRLADPTTTARNVSNRNHTKAIEIHRKGIDRPEIVLNSWDTPPKDVIDTITLEHFSEEDQKRIEKMKAHRGQIFSQHPVLARGRPEVLKANVDFNHKHKFKTQEEIYGKLFLQKVKETKEGKVVANSKPTKSKLSHLVSQLSSSNSSDTSSEAPKPNPIITETFNPDLERKKPTKIPKVPKPKKDKINKTIKVPKPKKMKLTIEESGSEKSEVKVPKPKKAPTPKKKKIIIEESSSDGSEKSEVKEKKSRGRPKGEPKPVKEKKPRGRPKGEPKPVKEKKPRGRPKGEPKPVKEKKARGRPKKEEVATKPIEEVKEVLPETKPDEDWNVVDKKGKKIKKGKQ